MNSLSGKSVTGQPEALSPARKDPMNRSGMRGVGARSGPPLKPASQSMYFQLVRLMKLTPGI